MEGTTGSTLVTGASSGIGLEIARGLAAQGAELVLPVRNRERGEAAIRSILSTVPGARVRLADMDLARLDSVSRFSAELRAEGTPIELLILNAGMIALGQKDLRLTADGFEPSYQTNYLGHFALTLGALPLLEAGGARVIVQCSLASAFGRFEPGNPRSMRGARSFGAYRRSKTALGMFGLELDRRSRERGWGVSVQLCHPGVAPGSEIAPSIRRRVPGPVVRWAVDHVGNSPGVAARIALSAAASRAPSPRMFAPSGWMGLSGDAVVRPPFRSFTDQSAAAALWERSEVLLP